MKTQKLGRGLSALLGEMDDVYENEMHQKDMIVELQLKDIKANPFQPRKYFNDESLAELGESIKNDGLLQPVVVTEEIDGYVLIAGERRVRASRLAKLKTIRAIVLNSDEQKMRQLALIENIQRDELNAIELAHAYGELIKLHSITQDELSVKIHKSRTHITNTMRLLQLSAKTQKAIVEKKITAGHAKVLVGLDDSTQQLIVDSIIGQKLSVRDVEAMIQNMKSSTVSKSVKEIGEPLDFSRLKYAFEQANIKAISKAKSITLEFDSQEKIDNFLKYF